MVRRVLNIVLDDQGATTIEYGLIIAMIILAMMAALTSFADGAIGMWNFVATSVATA